MINTSYNYSCKIVILETILLYASKALIFDRIIYVRKQTWNQSTVNKQMTLGLFKILPTNYSFTNHI